MLQSISKKKIYFYLLILIFLSTTFNFNFASKFNKLALISLINVEGLSGSERNELKKKLQIIEKKNIFFLKKEEVSKILETNNYIESYKVKKIFPSKILVNIEKTKFVAKTFFDGKNLYVGKNGKLTEISLVKKEYNLPQVFGKFQVSEFLKLQKILNLNDFNLKNIKKYYYYKSNRWDIETYDEITFMLPSNNIEKELKIYKSLLVENKIANTKLIDLRIKNKIILNDKKK